MLEDWPLPTDPVICRLQIFIALKLQIHLLNSCTDTKDAWSQPFQFPNLPRIFRLPCFNWQGDTKAAQWLFLLLLHVATEARKGPDLRLVYPAGRWKQEKHISQARKPQNTMYWYCHHLCVWWAYDLQGKSLSLTPAPSSLHVLQSGGSIWPQPIQNNFEVRDLTFCHHVHEKVSSMVIE